MKTTCRQLQANSISYANEQRTGTVGFLSCRQQIHNFPFPRVGEFSKKIDSKREIFHAKSGICDVIHKANDRFLADPWTSLSVTDYIFTIVVYGLV